MDTCRTPISQMQLSAELRDIILERNLLTTKTRMKVLSALEDSPRPNEDLKKTNLRSKAIHEILTSEASYLCHLELIMKYFMEPIQQKNYISSEDYTVIFGNIETIYYVNGELLNELKCNQENIAAAFLKLAPFLKLYSVYAYDYERALNRLNLLQRKSSVLRAFIESQENRPEVSTKLISLLITPIQRVPRYCLLLKEVIAHTPTSHPDYAVLQDSFQQVESAAQHINSLVQEQENMQKMLALQRSLCKGKPLIISPGRKFIKAGKLMKVCQKGRKVQPRYFILLSDMLLYCKLLNPDPSAPNSLACTCVLPLKKCRVQWVMGKTIFKVTCLNESFVLYSSSPDESGSWVAALSDAVRQFHEHRQTLRKGSSSKRPLRGRDIYSLWQGESGSSSPRHDRKRPYPKESLEEPICKDTTAISHGISHIDVQNQSSPHKVRKVATTSILKESTNVIISPDSLFPMRNEFTESRKPIHGPENACKQVDTPDAKCSSKSKRPSVKFEGVSKRVDEGSDKNGSRAAEGGATSSRLCHDSESCTSSRGGDSRRGSWHDRCYRAVRSLSWNLHHSFRKQIDKLSSSQPKSDLND
ncbi:rho guanine nucleotide exchange factor 39-like [Hetaerina americana]|uniref:rho guanine nucleotide exchange factor 39-like n=1 Tax=Hetaerina americana TaxID=62018 RepID=UPI003A7F1481